MQGFEYENQLEPIAEVDGSGNLIARFVYCDCGAGNISQYRVKNGVTYPQRSSRQSTVGR